MMPLIPESDNVMLQLCAFLLRRGATPADAWTATSLADAELFYWASGRAEPLSADDGEIFGAATPGDIVVALLRRLTTPPRWQEFIKNTLSLRSFGAAHESLGAVVFCAVPGEDSDDQVRWVAWTFGVAARALRRSAQDPRFGLLAVLNLLVVPLLSQQPSGRPGRRHRGPQLREMRYRTTAPYVQQTGHRAARDIPVEGFRVDRTSDLVVAVGGSGADPALATSTLLGGRSLRFRAGVARIEDLATLAVTAVDRSRATDYKEAFSWMDNIRPVDDPDLIGALRLQLAEELMADPDTPAVDVILPDDLIEVGDDRSIRYIVFPRERRTGQGRVTLTTAAVAGLLGQVADGDARDLGLDAELRFLDESESGIGTATVLECLSASLGIGDEDFIAYDGDFYRVSRSFVERIDSEISEIPASAIEFPRYTGETEPVYNAMAGKDHPAEFVELDRALIKLPGEYGIESSDLVAASGAMIHVKRKGKSSVLSHLFLQVANSCELLRRSAEARRQLDVLIRERARNECIVASVTAAHLAAEERRGEIEVAFAFLGDWKGKTVTSLPLFSRISLVSEARRVTNLGYRATVATISTR
jgi:uncharacterized protein (TIGR04141 family)